LVYLVEYDFCGMMNMKNWSSKKSLFLS